LLVPGTGHEAAAWARWGAARALIRERDAAALLLATDAATSTAATVKAIRDRDLDTITVSCSSAPVAQLDRAPAF
jgi:hypothetical protein